MKGVTTDLRDLLTRALAVKGADYMEVRVEETRTTRIGYRGKALDTVSQATAYGGSIRALYKGGWGFVSFNSLDGLEDKAKLAVEQARYTGQAIDGTSQLAPVPVVEDSVRPHLLKDPAEVPLDYKMSLLGGYNDLILSGGPRISSSVVMYFDRATTLYFANSEGSFIRQEKRDMGGNLAAIATAGSLTQTIAVRFGGSNDFNVALGLEDKLRSACQRVQDMLDAKPVVGGQYTVVCDPVLAGVFVHEAFGHLSESDDLYENEELKKIMQLGTVFGTPGLTVYDTGEDEGSRGRLVYDDEGVAARRAYLIKDGILVGRLHSRESAAKMSEEPTGSARALDYRFPPIVRMRNTRIAPGDATLEQMFDGIKLGVYAVSAYGGQTSGEMFTFTAEEGYMIRDGKLAEMVRDVTLQGNVFATLRNIDAIGRNFHCTDSAGGCGKGAQAPLPTSQWSPAIRIQNVVIGGRK